MYINNIIECSCGAISFNIDGGKDSFSMLKENFENQFGELDSFTDDQKSDMTYGSCNHCVNHWGLDLCACGSGEKLEDCNEGFDECGNPMQSIEDNYTHVRAKDSWI